MDKTKQRCDWVSDSQTTTWGTCFFISKQAAIEYYTPYEGEYAKKAVEQKLIEQAIFIGQPPVLPNQKILVNSEGRYFIQEKKEIIY